MLFETDFFYYNDDVGIKMKISNFIKNIAKFYVFLGFFGFASATDFKLPNYEFNKSKEPIFLVDKLPLKGDMAISFDFTLGKDFNSKNSPDYQGLFQTDSLNTGIRIEIDRKNVSWYLVIGDNTSKFSVYNLGKLPKIGVRNNVKIQIIKDTLFVFVNDKKIIKKIIDSKIDFMEFSTRNVAIGHGYVYPGRIFHGKISNFIITR